MAQPIFLPEPQFETFGSIQLASSSSISLSGASFSGGQIVVSRINVKNSGLDVDRAGVGVIKAVAWDYGWLVLKANGVVVAFNSVSTNEPSLRNDLPNNFISNVVDIAADGGYAVAVKIDGTLAEWRAKDSLPTATLPSGSGFVRVSVSTASSYFHLIGLAIKQDGTVVSWQGSPVGYSLPFVNVSSLNNIANVSTSTWHWSGSLILRWIAITHAGAIIYNGALQSDRSRIVNGFVGSDYYYAIDDSGKIFSNDGSTGGAANWRGFTDVVSGEIVSGSPHFLLSNGSVVDINGSVILTDIDRMYRGGGFVRRDGSVPLYNGTYRRAPQVLRPAVNSLGDNDFSLVYDGNVKNITPNYERPLGREVVSAAISPGNPKNVGTYGITYSISDVSYKIATADTTGVLTITPGAPIITKAQVLLGSVGIAFSRTPALTDAANRSATSWVAIGLPAWAQINSVTGQITGSPSEKSNDTFFVQATGPGGVVLEEVALKVTEFIGLEGSFFGSVEVVADLQVINKISAAFLAYAEIESYLYGADSFLPVSFNSYGALSVGGSFDFYGDVFLQFSEGSGFVGNLRLLALTRFAYGELYLVPFFSGKAEIYYYTTLNGKITPEPLVKLGIKFSSAQKLEYREEFIAPREFDYVPIASGGFVQGEINIPSSARYGIYNLWATKDLPPGDAAVHLAINLVRV